MLDSMSTPIDTQTCTDLLAQNEKKKKRKKGGVVSTM